MLHDSLQEFTPNAHVAVNGNEAKGVLAEGTVVRFSPERPGSPARIVIKSGEPPQEDSGCLYEFFYDRGSFGWRFDTSYPAEGKPPFSKKRVYSIRHNPHAA